MLSPPVDEQRRIGGTRAARRGGSWRCVGGCPPASAVLRMLDTDAHGLSPSLVRGPPH